MIMSTRETVLFLKRSRKHSEVRRSKRRSRTVRPKRRNPARSRARAIS